MIQQEIQAQISTSYARALMRTIADHGHDPVAFAALEGVELASLEQSGELSAAVFGRLCQRAVLLLRDESLGMVSGGPVATGTFRMMCLCVVHRPTLASIVTRAGEFFDVCNGVAIKPEVVESAHSAGVAMAIVRNQSERAVNDILRLEGPVRVRTSLYLWHSLLSWFAGRSLPLIQVEFAFDKPVNGNQWNRLFRCPVKFNCERSLILFDKAVLNYPNVQNEQSLRVFLKSAPYRLIVPSYHDHKISDRVVALFGDDFSQRLPSADQVSQQLGMSVSTLRRQLLLEGSSFQRLKDDCRRAAAVQYLASTDLTLAEIATLLGFDETSAFFRAFRRWAGTTPALYRASL